MSPEEIRLAVRGDVGSAMVLTILLYSLFTGLSALSVGFWDFATYRFLTGLGVGGQFAVGVDDFGCHNGEGRAAGEPLMPVGKRWMPMG